MGPTATGRRDTSIRRHVKMSEAPSRRVVTQRCEPCNLPAADTTQRKVTGCWGKLVCAAMTAQPMSITVAELTAHSATAGGSEVIRR